MFHDRKCFFATFLLILIILPTLFWKTEIFGNETCDSYVWLMTVLLEELPA